MFSLRARRPPPPAPGRDGPGSFRRRCGGSLLAGLLLLAGAAEGSTVVYLPLDEMARTADQIFSGAVVGVRSQFDARRTSIHTFVTIEVDSWLKGGRGSSLLTLRVLGGEAEGYRLLVAGAPRFEVGEEVLVFSSGGAGRVPSVLGLASGKFTLTRDETTGERVLHRSLAGLTLEDPAGSPVAADAVWPRGRATLDEVEAVVREALLRP